MPFILFMCVLKILNTICDFENVNNMVEEIVTIGEDFGFEDGDKENIWGLFYSNRNR